MPLPPVTRRPVPTAGVAAPAGAVAKPDQSPPLKAPENVFTPGASKVEQTGTAKSTETLRQAVSGAVNRINLALYDKLGSEGAGSVIAGVLTTTQFAQIMPALSAEQQQTILSKLGLSDLTPQEFVAGARAYAARFSEGLGEDVKLNQASFSYVQKGRELNPAIQGGEIRSIDFATEGAERINADISAATEKMIPELVEQSVVAPLEVFLAAAAYIDAPWGGGIRFDSENTTQGQFTVDGGRTAYPDLMVTDVAEQRLASGPGWEAVYLPNGESGNLGTVYIKPTEGTVKELIAKQGEKGLANIVADLTSAVAPNTQVGAVRIPKSDLNFKPDGKAFLSALQSLGLPSSAALLAGSTVDITDAAYVGRAQTNELGIKIAAAQGFGGLERMSIPPQPIVFDGNRSLLQLVVKDGQVLFFNPVIDP